MGPLLGAVVTVVGKLVVGASFTVVGSVAVTRFRVTF